MQLLKNVPHHSLLSYSDSIFSVKEFESHAMAPHKDTDKTQISKDGKNAMQVTNAEPPLNETKDGFENKDRPSGAAETASEETSRMVPGGIEGSLVSMEGVPMPPELYQQMLDMHSQLEVSGASMSSESKQGQTVESGDATHKDLESLAHRSSEGAANSCEANLYDFYDEFNPHTNPFRKKKALKKKKQEKKPTILHPFWSRKLSRARSGVPEKAMQITHKQSKRKSA